jgi:hypothetical protein
MIGTDLPQNRPGKSVPIMKNALGLTAPEGFAGRLGRLRSMVPGRDLGRHPGS